MTEPHDGILAETTEVQTKGTESDVNNDKLFADRDRNGDLKIKINQGNREDSERVLELLAEDLLFIYGVSKVKDVIVPPNDSLKRGDKELEKYYDTLREEHGLVDGSRIITTYSFVDKKRLVNMFVDNDNVPRMVFDDDSALGSRMFFDINFFSHPDATHWHVMEWYRHWSRDIKFS